MKIFGKAVLIAAMGLTISFAGNANAGDDQILVSQDGKRFTYYDCSDPTPGYAGETLDPSKCLQACRDTGAECMRIKGKVYIAVDQRSSKDDRSTAGKTEGDKPADEPSKKPSKKPLKKPGKK